jgi:integrase
VKLGELGLPVHCAEWAATRNGLGPAGRGSAPQAGDSVRLARGLAHEAREMLLRDIDPIDERDKGRGAAREADHEQRVAKARVRLTLARAALLTAARTSEALMATLGEFDLQSEVWTVPAERMKAREPHVVHLSGPALAALAKVQGLQKTWVFPSPMLEDKPLSNMAMLAMLDRMGERERTTVHGLCLATFSTWANETGAARPDVIEACLAHQEGNKIRAVYNRAISA